MRTRFGHRGQVCISLEANRPGGSSACCFCVAWLQFSWSLWRYRIQWDEARFGFLFTPASGRWKERAKAAGHGVLVRSPRYMIPAVEGWSGYSVRKEGSHIYIRRGSMEAVIARVGDKIPLDHGSFARVSIIRDGKFVELVVPDIDPFGAAVERSIRLTIRPIDGAS